MGIELARVASQLGAEVTLVCGPSKESTKDISLRRVDVISALEMQAAMEENYEQSDIVIMSAAVADYRPLTQAEQKIKKDSENLTIELTKNPDILKGLGEKKTHQILVGFALETNNEVEFAQGKLAKKNLDFIVLNSLNDKEAGFQKDTNKITILSKKGDQIQYEAKNKTEVAKDIINFILENYNL